MSDFVDQFGGDQTSDSEVTSSDESDFEEEIEGSWTHIIGDDQQPQRVEFTSHPGPKIHLPDTAKPVDYFRLFISSRFIELLVPETNRYADQWQTLATGTVRTNRKGLPKQLLATKLNSQEICERRKGSLLCIAYKDHGKRPVLLSTKATYSRLYKHHQFQGQTTAEAKMCGPLQQMYGWS
ncbi:transposase [Elysia marginata]|uniref:Transposase n=1 Tax=Elysia marginata TaxID=1093978 RepID=A0AAV4GZW4_9GAST|nr:transposase [Elysia marginata]